MQVCYVTLNRHGKVEIVFGPEYQKCKPTIRAQILNKMMAELNGCLTETNIDLYQQQKIDRFSALIKQPG